MFDISFGEIFLILVVSLVVLGPKQLSTVAVKIGGTIYAIKQYFHLAKQDLYYKSGIPEVINTKKQLVDIYQNLHKTTNFNDENIKNHELPNLNFDEIISQPELDFDRQPELFDEPRNY